MCDELKAYKQQDFILCNKFRIHHPTLDEIVEYGEERYWQEISILTATPADEKLYLYSLGIDYNTMQDFQLFIKLCKDGVMPNNCLMLPDMNFNDYISFVYDDDLSLYNEQTDTVITKSDYIELTDYIRQIHGFKKNETRDGNDHTKRRRLEIELERLQRKINSGKKDEYHSQLKIYISALTNQSGFKYNWHTVWDLPINVFIDCLFRLQIIDRSKSLNQGLYSGNIDYKKIKNKEEFNWLRPIKNEN